MPEIPPYEDSPPNVDAITDYDWRHRITYLRLFDAARDGADWREAVEIIFGFDVDAHPERAKRIYDSHLARARWMSEVGYRYLVQGRFVQ
ncbi:DUF2285 domain-containing protein [Mesorhizobium sp.]|uniref:DUF2285 domain-containing protein n=2 Tax=Mesorhizobium delmotii TaxID=1631247 RepID=A0A2P9AGS6_9HYPH|nr:MULTISPECIES: DUF2285 domain-containing protein [Mesorhizobium]RWO26683.1 MAG: DUF2285 domain-containing protein [Mesorhizobium sp.]RWP53444.1 MAG: DUF2285 domain-containing protein [Mesorhizobium sp.]SJM30341.1 conserved hypothetical protein [Mesorhizobium delmotii]